MSYLVICGYVNRSVVQALQLLGHQRHPEGCVKAGCQDHLGGHKNNRVSLFFHTCVCQSAGAVASLQEKRLGVKCTSFCHRFRYILQILCDIQNQLSAQRLRLEVLRHNKLNTDALIDKSSVDTRNQLEETFYIQQ